MRATGRCLTCGAHVTSDQIIVTRDGFLGCPECDGSLWTTEDGVNFQIAIRDHLPDPKPR